MTGGGSARRLADVAAVLVLFTAACTTVSPVPPDVDWGTKEALPGTKTDPAPEVGSTGDNLVFRLQTDLGKLGYYEGETSGTFDGATREALRRFEEDLRLIPDGFYDLIAAEVIDLAVGRSPSTATLQSALAMLGYYEGPIHGIATPATLEAVTEAERAAGLPSTGRFGPELARVLLDQIRSTQPQGRWVSQPALPGSNASQSPRASVPPRRVTAQTSPAGVSVAFSGVQLRLLELGYRPGPVDGERGPQTKAAIVAFQKREGLTPDGIVGPETLRRLDAPRGPGPRSGLPIPRIEIDLARQLLFVVLADGSVTTLGVSTGNGLPYLTESGATAVAHTPVGVFRIQRRIDGVRQAPLGTLYRPLYFHRGWAIHGSNHVPAYPASHGCVRTTRWDQDWLFGLVDVGVAVVIYDAGPSGGEGSPANAAPGS